MGEKRVVLLVDNKKRDLPGAALIAHHLAGFGVDCFLEPLEAYKGALAAHRPDMIVFNHLTGSHLVAYSKRLSELGVMVAVLPNEGILYDPDVLKFNAGKYHNGAHIDYFFCWNSKHRDAILSNSFETNTHVEVIGPPRFDYYFKPWSDSFNIKSGNEGGKPRLLVCTNFVFARFKDIAKETVDKFFAPWKDRIPKYKDYWSAIEANYKSRRRFFDFLDEIVGSGKFSVTLRPHPGGENIEVYRRWYEGLGPSLKKDVTLDVDSSITELILSCDIEVSCETCTTALESWIARKPTVELVFERHPLFYHPDIASLNVLCDDPKDVVPVIEEQLKDPAQAPFQEARLMHLKKWCDSPEGLSSFNMAKTISDALEGKRETGWRALSLDERRKGLKLKLLSALDLPYNYNPQLFIKKRLFVSRYKLKEQTYNKTIRPSDAAAAVSALQKSLAAKDKKA